MFKDELIINGAIPCDVRHDRGVVGPWCDTCRFGTSQEA
jgi:hypothetical protein